MSGLDRPVRPTSGELEPAGPEPSWAFPPRHRSAPGSTDTGRADLTTRTERAGSAASPGMSLTLTETALGFRYWRISGDRLVALGGEIWEPGDVTAHCRQQRRHQAPGQACGCGIYGLHDAPRVIPPGRALGAIAAWGSMLVHPDGFRAARARPIVLAHDSQDPAPAIADLAAAYGIPLVQVDALESVAREFAASIPREELPVGQLDLVRRLTASISARERCAHYGQPFGSPGEPFADSLLWLLANGKESSDFGGLLVGAWLARARPSLTRADVEQGMHLLRLKVEEQLRAARGDDPDGFTAALLCLLEALHGSAAATAAALADAGRAGQVPFRLLAARPTPRARKETTTIARARLEGDDLLTLEAEAAVFFLAPQLDGSELERLLLRMRSGCGAERLLREAGERAPRLARVAVAESAFSSTLDEGARILGREARPLLLGELRRRPWAFTRGVPVARALVGASELRLASECALRSATDPRETVAALALLPGEEARLPLRRVMDRVGRLHPGAGDFVAIRTWRTLCSCEHLVKLLDADVLTNALEGDRLDPETTAQLLRSHPTASPAAALRLWRSAYGTPRFAADALRASGEHRPALVTEALAGMREAWRDAGAALNVTAALAVEGRAHAAVRRAAEEALEDRALPATLRATAAWVLDHPGDASDPVLARYRRWRIAAAADRVDPIVALLSGAWQYEVGCLNA